MALGFCRGPDNAARLLAGDDLDGDRAPGSPHFEEDFLADFFRENFMLELTSQSDLRPIDFQDDIPLLQIAGFHRGSLFDPADDHAFGNAREKPLEVGEFLDAGDIDPQPWAHDMALCHDLRGDILHRVDRDGEPEAAVVAADEGVDSDDAPLDVAERAPAVSGVDRGVGLDEFVAASDFQITALGADHADRERVGKFHRGADREGEFPDPHRVAVAQSRNRKMVAFDL